MTIAAFIRELRQDFIRRHVRKEDLFWEVKMGLSADRAASADEQHRADLDYQRFMQDPERAKSIRAIADAHVATPAERDELDGWLRLFACHTLENPEARALSAEILALETELAKRRAGFQTGWVHPVSGAFQAASTNKLALLIANDPDAAVRRAALDGLYQVERFVLENGFIEILKLRNRLGRLLGYEDYYDWKVAIAEGQRKSAIFERLEHFLAATEATTRHELDRFAAERGDGALDPWNFQFLRAGTLSRQLDPHFPIGDAVARWVRSFGAMGIHFRGATLTLDLIDRIGKYENGFMHGPGIAHTDFDGTWHPARINFTANAVPGAIGAGLTATTTLFHEGGHAAHFANITAGAPCFAHEFPPTSVAYAETQSMFLDSLLGDADWRARYALNASGEGVPWELVERQIREEQPFKGWDTRRLITVPMGERFLYELPEDDLTTERIIEGLRAIERKVQGLSASARPILAVPHLISAESSAYYHAYVLAEMAVQQTRAFFLERDGYLTDNPRIGPDLAAAYWAPGNRVTHDATLVALTGRPLGADAIIADANRSVDACLAEARRDWERAATAKAAPMPESLDARIRLVHGPEIIADSDSMSLQEVCDAFSAWCTAHQRAQE